MELRGEYVVLTSVNLDLAEALLPAFNGDEQFNSWAGHNIALTLEEVRADILQTLNLPDGVVWRITDLTGVLVGVAETAHLLSPHTAWIDLLIIRREFQGRGYGSQAATLLENHLFSYPEINQVGLGVLVQNAPALTFWERRGYVRGVRYLDSDGDDIYKYHLHHK